MTHTNLIITDGKGYIEVLPLSPDDGHFLFVCGDHEEHIKVSMEDLERLLEWAKQYATEQINQL
jgi:hypothetical protein